MGFLKQTHTEMNVYTKAFLGGFFYVFGLCNNPMAAINRSASNRSDNDMLANDWNKTSQYIKNAYETAKESVQKQRK